MLQPAGAVVPSTQAWLEACLKSTRLPASGYMFAIEKKGASKQGRCMLPHEKKKALLGSGYINLGLGETRGFFKLTNPLSKLSWVLPLTNQFPRYSGVLCPLSNPILSQARQTGLYGCNLGSYSTCAYLPHSLGE